MTHPLNGACHCGSIRVAFMPSMSAADLPLRACQCGFCRRHGARTTSDPASSLHITAVPGSLGRYRFGRRQVDALMCRECGVYVGSLLSVGNHLLATLNVAGSDLDAFAGRTAEPISYDHETDAEKLARRKARLTPTVLVEASPSA
ncbi:hypothetical protein BH11PSE2_BH11PSE2_01890 [soil metagenome]